MGRAKEVIEQFWTIQDEGDYTKVVDLFSDDAVLVDPFFGTFNGKPAIAEFMKKMNEETAASGTSFFVREIAGDDEVAWAQWTAKMPSGEIDGCGLYRVEKGLISYYKDYMNAAVETKTV